MEIYSRPVRLVILPLTLKNVTVHVVKLAFSLKNYEYFFIYIYLFINFFFLLINNKEKYHALYCLANPPRILPHRTRFVRRTRPFWKIYIRTHINIIYFFNIILLKNVNINLITLIFPFHSPL